jgi:hypothetical protein
MVLSFSIAFVLYRNLYPSVATTRKYKMEKK